MADVATTGTSFVASPFTDAVLTPSFSVQSTGPAGDRAAPREGGGLPIAERDRPVVEIGRRLPLLAGRVSELDDLNSGIQSGQSFEIFAGEGFGKTSLVNMLLHDRPELKGFHPDGVVLVTGRTVGKGDLVGALFRTFFTADQSIALDDAEMLRRLSPVRALIVLDDLDIADDDLQGIIAALTSPIFVVTSGVRRLHDFASKRVGPLENEDLLAVAEIRLGHELDMSEEHLVVELAHLVGDCPRSWARAIELVEGGAADLRTLVDRLQTVRDPEQETARLALADTSPAALGVVSLVSELDGAGMSEELLEEVLDLDDASASVVEIEAKGLGIVQDGVVTIADDVAQVASARLDGERVVNGALDRLVEWTGRAEPEKLVEEVPSITAFAEWALEHDRAAEVVELGRRTDDALARRGRWGAAAILLLLVARAGEACNRPADTAWALHQMGVRELALDDKIAAKPHLKEARAIRRRIGDKAGEALTHEHLKLLGPLAAATGALVAKIVLGIGITVAAVVGGLIALDRGGSDPNPDDIANPDDTIVAPPTTGPPVTSDVGGDETIKPPPPDVADPPAVSAELDGDHAAMVKVAAASTLREGEEIQVSRLSPDGTEKVLMESALVTQVLDRGLLPESTYRYRARIIGGVESSPWSDEATVLTGGSEPPIAPEPPEGLVGQFGGGAVRLSWQASVSDGVVGYDVIRDERVVAQDLVDTTFLDTRPISGGEHTYHVIAVDEGGIPSARSAASVVSIPGDPKPPPPPTGLVGSYTRGKGITLAWSGTTSSYRVNRVEPPQTRIVSERRLLDTEVVEGERYEYRVFAVDRFGESSAESIVVPAVHTPPPPPPAPPTPTANVVGSSVRLAWGAPAGYVHPVDYEVRRNGTAIASDVTDPSHDDPLPPDGTYSYTVIAVNTDGVRSEPSPAREIVIEALTVAPKAAAFGAVRVGRTGEIIVDVTNNYARPIELGALDVIGTGFTLAGDTCPNELSGRASCEVTVNFEPTTAGTKTGELRAAAFGVLAPLSGEGATSTFALTVSVSGSGTGAVTSSPLGIDCPSSCTTQFAEDAVVTLTATPQGSSSFGQWTGACTGTGTCEVTMAGAETVTAVFDPPIEHSLTIDLQGGGSGVITSVPGGLTCSSGSCVGSFEEGTDVTITADPDSTSEFAGWTNSCYYAGTSCTITMSGDVDETAYFETIQFGLTIDLTGSGSGTVGSSPPGLTCSAGSCFGSFDIGTSVEVLPNPASGSFLKSWGGACSGSSSSCLVTMNGHKTASVQLEPLTYSLTVNITGTGSGFVSSNPSGIGCAPTCARDFDNGETVSLTADEGSGSDFIGWSGACSGTGACQVSMTGDKSVTARFDDAYPVPPTGLSFSSGTGNLTWTASTSSDVVSYDIYYEDSGGSYVYEGSVANPTTTWSTDCGYTYYVIAVDADGLESDPSATHYANC